MVEVERSLDGDGVTDLRGHRLKIGPELARQRVTLRLDGHLLHVVHHGVLAKTIASPIPADHRSRLRGARIATSELPAPAEGPISVQRKVPVDGVVMVARQRLRVGRSYAGLIVTIYAEDTHLRVIHNGTELSLQPLTMEVSQRIEEELRPFARQIELLETIPGVGRSVAEILIAETGADMTRFRTAGYLASWAGTTPGHYESAGKSKSGKTRHGNRWLGQALGTAAMAAARTRNNTFLGARYHRLVPRLGKKKALVAIEHSILVAVWHMLSANLPYQDLGGDFFDNLDPDRVKRRALAQLHRLGYQVELTLAS